MAYAQESTEFGCLIIHAAEAVAGYKGKAIWFGQIRRQIDGKIVKNFIEFSGKDEAERFQYDFRKDSAAAIRRHVTAQRPKLTDLRPEDHADDSGLAEANAEARYAAGNVVYY